MGRPRTVSEPIVQVVNVVEKLLYRKEEAAFALGISTRSVEYLIGLKELRSRRVGGRVVIPAEDVKKFAAKVVSGKFTGDITLPKKTSSQEGN